MNVVELERQVEYKFAPAPLLAIQALANTFSFEDEEERLLDPVAAREWLVASELATADVEVGENGFKRLLEFRELIRRLLDANLTGVHEADANGRLARIVAEHPIPLAVDATGDFSLDLDPPATVDGVISQLAGIVFQAQLDASWPRLKVCANDECRWAFYDSSRNRGGTWCRMDICGNRVKNRNYRRRSAAHG